MEAHCLHNVQDSTVHSLLSSALAHPLLSAKKNLYQEVCLCKSDQVNLALPFLRQGWRQ